MIRRLANFGIIATLNKITVDMNPIASNTDFVIEIAVSNVKPWNTGLSGGSSMESSNKNWKGKEKKESWILNRNGNRTDSLCFSKNKNNMQKQHWKAPFLTFKRRPGSEIWRISACTIKEKEKRKKRKRKRKKKVEERSPEEEEFKRKETYERWVWDRNRSKGKNQKQTLDVGKQRQLFRGTEKLYRWKKKRIKKEKIRRRKYLIEVL